MECSFIIFFTVLLLLDSSVNSSNVPFLHWVGRIWEDLARGLLIGHGIKMLLVPHLASRVKKYDILIVMHEPTFPRLFVGWVVT